MARPDRSDERRAELLPVLTQVFAEQGYTGTTTAALAAAAGLRENQLYRLWPSKKKMFLAVIDFLYRAETSYWQQKLGEGDSHVALEKLLDEQGRRRGQSGLHRIIFAGLSESHDPEVREALVKMYRNYHRFISRVIKQTRAGTDADQPSVAQSAWAMIALGTLINVARELDVFPVSTQRRMLIEVGGLITRGVAGDDAG